VKPEPDVQLLANGDILVPVKDDGGGWRITRVTPDEAEYAEWLSVVQQRERGPGTFARAVDFWTAGALVFFGIFIGITVITLLVVLIVRAFR
jgi:hypothetical protein